MMNQKPDENQKRSMRRLSEADEQSENKVLDLENFSINRAVAELKLKTMRSKDNRWLFVAWKHIHRLLVFEIEAIAIERAKEYNFQDKEHIPLLLFMEMFPTSSFLNQSLFYTSSGVNYEKIQKWTADYLQSYYKEGDSRLFDEFIEFYKNSNGDKLDSKLARYHEDKEVNMHMLYRLTQIGEMPSELKGEIDKLFNTAMYGIGKGGDFVLPPPYLLMKQQGIFKMVFEIMGLFYSGQKIAPQRPESYIYPMLEELLGRARNLKFDIKIERFFENLYSFDGRRVTAEGREMLGSFNEILQSYQNIPPEERYRFLALFEDLGKEKVSMNVTILQKPEDDKIALEACIINIKVNGKWDDRKAISLFKKMRGTDGETDGRKRYREVLVNRAARKLLADLAIASDPPEISLFPQGYGLLSFIKEKRPADEKAINEMIKLADPKSISELNTMYRRLFALELSDEAMINRRLGTLNIKLSATLLSLEDSINLRI